MAKVVILTSGGNGLREAILNIQNMKGNHMSNEEAIQRFLDFSNSFEMLGVPTGACEVAISAIEKQIAMKPTYDGNFKITFCKCGARTLPGQNYCSYCGQALEA